MNQTDLLLILPTDGKKKKQEKTLSKNNQELCTIDLCTKLGKRHRLLSAVLTRAWITALKIKN